MKEKTGSSQESSNRRRYSLFPAPLSKSVDQLVKPVYKKHGFAEHRILTEWHMIVGHELAGVCVPLKLTRPRGGEGGTLHVLAAAARALELQHLEPQILERIAIYFGYKAVRRLSLMQTSSPLLRREPEPERKPALASSGTLAALAGQCEDEDLRKAFLSLADAIAGK